MNLTSSSERPVEGASVRALTEADLHVHFQPIVRVSDGTIYAQEALVRCQVPELRSPMVLLERAVEENECGRLGRKIRNIAFSSCQGLRMFVNVHPAELSSPWLVQPDDPMCLHDADVFLEITETATFEHFDLCISVLKEVCSRTGARLVVDDMGAGHSNLLRVLELEPKVVKIDLALVRDIDRLPRKQAVLKHLLRLCNDLDASVVAEGIETIEELKTVADLGVQFVQGYLLARPGYPPPAVAWPLRGGRPGKTGSSGTCLKV